VGLPAAAGNKRASVGNQDEGYQIRKGTRCKRAPARDGILSQRRKDAKVFPAGKIFSATLRINYTGKGHFQHSADLAFLFFLIKKGEKIKAELAFLPAIQQHPARFSRACALVLQQF